MYETVFEVTGKPGQGFWQGSLFVVLGLAALAFWFRQRRRDVPGRRRWFPLVWGCGALLVGGLLALFTGWGEFVAFRALRDGKVDVAVGTVQVLREQPFNGHAPGDLVVVDGQTVEVDYYRSSPGYHTTISHGGVLREGAEVRLFAKQGKALRIDLKR